MDDISSISPHDDNDHNIADQLKAESVDSALGGSTISALGEPHASSTPIKYTEREQELARIIDEIDGEMDDELIQEYGSDFGGPGSLPATLRFDTLSTPTQLLAHTNSDSARVQLLMDQLRRCQTQLREAKYRCDVLEVERESQERKIQDKMEGRIETLMAHQAKTEMTLKGKLAEQQAENKALLDQLQQAKDDLDDKTRGKATIMWKHTETVHRLQSELTDSKLMLKKVEAQLQEELHQRKDTAEYIAKLNNQIHGLRTQKENAPQLTRKINLLEEQVQFLKTNLDDSRREHALKVAAVEQRLLTENNKLKVKEKDYQRKYKREQDRNRTHSQSVKSLAAELRQVKEDVKMGVNMDRVKSPVAEGGGWGKFRPESKKHQKTLQDILQAIETEGGPDSNQQHATDAAYFQMVIFYLWMKREDSIKILKETRERLKLFDNCPNDVKELVTEKETLKDRVQELEERLSDWMAENDTLQSSAHLTTTQLVGTKHELELKVKHLQDTVSALHLDNNLLRAELEKSPAPKLSAHVQDLTADLKLKLDVADTELKQEKLVTEELGTELKHSTAHCDQLTKALQEKENEHKQVAKKLREATAKVIDLEKKKSMMDAQITRLQQENGNGRDNAQKLEKKLRAATSDLSQVKQKQDKTNRARDALKSQIDALKGEVIEARGQNVSLMQDNEILEEKLQDAQDELEKVQTQLEVQQHEIVSKSTEDQVEAQVLTETLKTEQDRVEELDLDIICKNAKISQQQLQMEQQEKKHAKKIQVEKAKFKGLQEALKEKEVAVADLQKKLRDEVTERNSKLLGLKHQLAIQESKIQQEHIDKVAKLQEQLDEQEKEFAEKEREEQAKHEKLKQTLADKEAAITDLEMQMADILDEKENVVSDLQKQITEQDKNSKAEKEKEMSQLKEQQEHEKKLSHELKDEKTKCKDLQKDIHEKNDEINKVVKNMEDKIKKRNNQIAKLQSDMKNQEENAKIAMQSTISDLQEKLTRQERKSSERLQEEQDKRQALQDMSAKKDEMLAGLEKLLEESKEKASKISSLEKQLQEQEKNFNVEVDEEMDRLTHFEEKLNDKEATITELKRKLGKQDEEKSLKKAEQKRREEMKRTEELIKLEEKMSVLIDEKEKLQDKIQILSKDKTVLQADKQLLELELADRTKKLQRIMKQSSITGTNNSSRSSSRRSSIDSRSGKVRKDNDKDVKKTKKIKKTDGIDGFQDFDSPRSGRESSGTIGESGATAVPAGSTRFQDFDSPRNGRGNSGTIGESGTTAVHGSSHHTMPTNKSESDKKEDEERLKNIDEFVTILLDLHTSEDMELDFENLRSEIEAIQKKADSGSNKPVEKQKVVVAKLGALYHIMKAKQTLADREKQQTGGGHKSPSSGAPMEISDNVGTGKHKQKPLRIPEPESPFSMEEKSLLHSMPPLLLEAMTYNNEEVLQQHVGQSHDQPDSQRSSNNSKGKTDPPADPNKTGSANNVYNKGSAADSVRMKTGSMRSHQPQKGTTSIMTPKKGKPTCSNVAVVDEDTGEPYGICKGLDKSKKASRQLKDKTNKRPEEKVSSGTGALSYYTKSGSRTDGGESFIDEGDDDVFCETGVQNEAELERLAIMHELVTQLRQSPDKEMKGSTLNRAGDLGFSMSKAENLDESINKEVDPFEAETWLLEVAEKVEENQEKIQIFKPEDEIILPSPLTNGDKCNPQSASNKENAEKNPDDNDNLDDLEVLMEALGQEDGTGSEQVDLGHKSLQPQTGPGETLHLPDKINQDSWLSEIAEKMLNNQEQPRALMPDVEIVESCPSDGSEQGHLSLPRMLQPDKLEAKLEARVESCLHSANPDGTDWPRFSSNSDTDVSNILGGSMTKTGGLKHTTSFEDTEAKGLLKSGNDIDILNQKMWHEDLVAKLQDHASNKAVVKDNEDNKSDVDKLVDSKSVKSSVSQEEQSDLDWKCEKQARHMGLRDYTSSSNRSAHQKARPKDHTQKSGKRYPKKNKHSNSDSSGNEAGRLMASVTEQHKDKISRSKTGGRRKLPSLQGSKIPISKGMHESASSSNDLSGQESVAEESNPKPCEGRRVRKTKDDKNKLKWQDRVQKGVEEPEKLHPVEESISVKAEVPLHANQRIPIENRKVGDLTDALPEHTQVVCDPELERGLDPKNLKSNIDLSRVPQHDKETKSDIDATGASQPVKQDTPGDIRQDTDSIRPSQLEPMNYDDDFAELQQPEKQTRNYDTSSAVPSHTNVKQEVTDYADWGEVPQQNNAEVVGVLPKRSGDDSFTAPSQLQHRTEHDNDLHEVPQQTTGGIIDMVNVPRVPHPDQQNFEIDTGITAIQQLSNPNRKYSEDQSFNNISPRVLQQDKQTALQLGERGRSAASASDIEQEQFGIGITQYIDEPGDDFEDMYEAPDEELQSMADDEASDNEQMSNDVMPPDNKEPDTADKDTQTTLENDFKQIQTEDVVIVEEVPSTSSIECQTEVPSSIQDNATSVECQTEDQPDQLPSTSSVKCQTEDELPSTSSVKCQTEDELPSTSSVKCQTEDELPSTSSVKCQTDDELPSTSSVKCQTEDELPSTSNAECQTEDRSTTHSTSCQTDPEDDTLEVTLKDKIEDLQNLSDRQKMKKKAFKETAKAYKGELQRMQQQMVNDRGDLASLHDKTNTQEAQLHDLTHKNNELEVDLNLTRDYLDKKKDECKELQQAVYDAETKERDLTSTVKEIQDQLDIEMQMQDKLNKRCADLESELLDATSKLLKTGQSQQPNQTGADNNQDLNNTSPVSPIKTAKQVQNQTDDRKKLSELLAKANGLEAQTEIDKITIDSLKEENQHLRGIISKLKDKAYSKWKEHPDSRLEDVYHALAKAQVKALAMKLEENPDDMLNNTMTAFGDTLTTPSPRPASSGLGTTLGSEYGYN